MRVVIFGGGSVGRTLVRLLEGKQYAITIVDENKELCDMLANESGAQVICGDATNPELLDELRLGDVDFVFAVTGNEEVNFLISVYAKQHANAKKVISRASEANYSRLMKRLDVEPLIPELTLAQELANKVTTPTISLLLDPTYSHVELVEQEVAGKLENKKVSEVGKKKDYVIVSVFEGGKFVYPEPDLVLERGMRVIVVRHT